MKLRLTAMILCLSLLLSLTGCITKKHIEILTEGVPPDPVSTTEEMSDNTDVTESGEDIGAAVMDFAVRLFQQSANSEENVLISPVSVLYALAMTANGAAGNTLAQMETVFGAPITALNSYLPAYMNGLPNGDGYKLHIANAIWFREDDALTVQQAFLDLNAAYYGADMYLAPFDTETLKFMNKWANEKTDGMIPQVLDSISNNAVMYLVNALAFDAEWENLYKENQIGSGGFTLEDGTVRDTEMMYSEESLYLENESASGFIKYYTDRAYAFAALLPNEWIGMEDYIASLTGEELSAILNSAVPATVEAAIPKFTAEYSGDMGEILAALGMEDAFDEDMADFSLMGYSDNGNIFISRVLHKTYMAVDERGTKAGAVTVVEMETGASLPEHIVCLDRPFVYLLIDCETNTPIFIGVMMDVNG